MITCTYTKTKKVKDVEITTSLQVTDDSGYEEQASNIIEELWKRFEAKEAVEKAVE